MAEGQLTFTDNRRDDPLGDAERAAILANPGAWTMAEAESATPRHLFGQGLSAAHAISA